MRKLIFLFLLTVTQTTLGQILQPAKLIPVELTQPLNTGDEVELIFKVQVDKNWYVYTTGFDPECGPLLMEVKLEPNKGFELIGGLVAIQDKTKHDKIFECEVKYFEITGEFRQKIKILSGPNLELKGSYGGQACSNISFQCVQVNGDLYFPTLPVRGKTITSPKVTPDTKTQPRKSTDVKQSPENFDTPSVKADSGLVKTDIDSSAQKAVHKTVSRPSKNTGPILDASLLEASDYDAENETMWGYMLLAFFLGITSLITPCVFPMIPMTVTFFLKDGQSKSQGIRMAILFGISIIVIYTIVGTIFAVVFGPEGLNALATHWLPNLLIFVLFIVFALSFLGLFEINAPYQLVNKADRAAERGGYIGIFFMSATLVLVSFSCTIPLVGNVLVLAAGGQIIKPIMGMFAYSLAFAIPFTVFAMFPEWLKSIPKSGGWLNTVKVTLGLLELALALKFFSIADQTYHWGLLDRDVNIAIWIVIFTVLGFYLLGKIRMKSDAVVEKLNVARLMFSIAIFSFVIYLIPGLWGAPLKALAGYLPPMHTHDFDLLAATRSANSSETCGVAQYSEFLHLPHGLQGYFDYDQAIECARAQNKPLFIDFTGHGCTNCREMEAVVWSDPGVIKRLNEDYVVVALYVDDKTELPENKWYTSNYDGKIKKTIGKQNADLQITNLDNNAQPFYVLAGKDETVLVTPYSYNRSVNDFIEFLDKGKAKYTELYK
jgi:thiol:disulfide interchange protein